MSLLTSQPSLGNPSPLQRIFQLLLIQPAVAPIDSYYGSRPTSFFGKELDSVSAHRSGSADLGASVSVVLDSAAAFE